MLRSTVSRASLVLLLVLATLPKADGTLTYTSGSTTVEISEELLDENNSTKKCVQFTSGAPEKYEKGCFSVIYTDGGTFEACTLEFDEMECNACQRCNTADDLPGYKIDCNNIEPEEGTDFLCDELTDLNVQRLLVDTKFDSQPFNWTAAQDGGDSTGGGNVGDSPPAQNTGSAAPSAAVMSMGAILGGVLSLLNLLY